MVLRFQKLLLVIGGFFTGVINGLLGAGGGMVAVPAMNKAGVDTKKSHATSIAIILPLSIFSCYFYLKNGHVALSDVWRYLPFGLAGAVIGSFLLKKISNIWLTRIFGGFMIYAAVRMFFR